jgi:hypothetical protein
MSDDVGRLRRWEDAGGTWRILGRSPAGLVLALCTCDAGEEVDRLHSADPALRAYVGDRRRSDEPDRTG